MLVLGAALPASACRSFSFPAPSFPSSLLASAVFSPNPSAVGRGQMERTMGTWASPGPALQWGLASLCVSLLNPTQVIPHHFPMLGPQAKWPLLLGTCCSWDTWVGGCRGRVKSPSSLPVSAGALSCGHAHGDPETETGGKLCKGP